MSFHFKKIVTTCTQSQMKLFSYSFFLQCIICRRNEKGPSMVGRGEHPWLQCVGCGISQSIITTRTPVGAYKFLKLCPFFLGICVFNSTLEEITIRSAKITKNVQQHPQKVVKMTESALFGAQNLFQVIQNHNLRSNVPI